MLKTLITDFKMEVDENFNDLEDVKMKLGESKNCTQINGKRKNKAEN